MNAVTEIAFEKAKRGFFTRQEMAYWIGTSGARLDALLKRAVGTGDLSRICRGLYCLDKRYLRAPLNPMDLAQSVYGPSYISLESALLYHEWIPEAVYAITSVSLSRSRDFNTPLGYFSFTRVPQSCFYLEVNRVAMEGGDGLFFMASPLKALADYVYFHHYHWSSVGPVLDSLRVEESSLATLTSDSFDLLLTNYKAGWVQRFLAGLRKDLTL